MSVGQTEVDSVRAIKFGSRRMRWRSPMPSLTTVIKFGRIINDRDQAMRSHLYGHAMPCDLIDHLLVHTILDLGRELVKNDDQ